MISKSTAMINISAYRQLQSELRGLIFKMSTQIDNDPVIYTYKSPETALEMLEEVDEYLENVIYTLANDGEEEFDFEETLREEE